MGKDDNNGKIERKTRKRSRDNGSTSKTATSNLNVAERGIIDPNNEKVPNDVTVHHEVNVTKNPIVQIDGTGSKTGMEKGTSSKQPMGQEEGNDDVLKGLEAHLHGELPTERVEVWKDTNQGTRNNEEGTEVPTVHGMWEAMKGMMEQLSTISKSLPANTQVAPEIQPQPQAIVEVEPLPRTQRDGDYLDLLERITRLGTKKFLGGSNPMAADEWKSRLVRNFRSTRCPSHFQKDIAAHFLEEDANNWWETIEKRNEGRELSFADFEAEFKRKYFPAEAYDKLECQFLELVQGDTTVREYEEKFNRLRRYVGRELEDERTQVRRFLRGLRHEIKIPCSVRTFGSVSELVEKAALIEEGIKEENRSNRARISGRDGNTNHGDKRKRANESGKSNEPLRLCDQCGKRHGGQCRKALGLCLRCGSADHKIQNCPRMYQGAKVTSDYVNGCYYCKRSGHIQRDCPKLREERDKEYRASHGGEEPPTKRQAVAPRVYELKKNDAMSYDAITGKSLP